MSAGSLRTFLATAKRTLQATKPNPNQRISFVVGNESCDLDSITSAIVYAYLGSQAAKPASSGPKYAARTIIPLLNIHGDEIEIRPELLTLLKHTNLEPSLLLSLDDMHEYGMGIPPEETQWILVDHNALTGPLAKFSSSVIGCIDHHVDEKQVPSTNDAPRIITTSGSCTSLVVNHFRSVWDGLTQAASANPAASQSDVFVAGDDKAMRTAWDAVIAKFAMASILVDTQNLQNKHKTVESDVEAVQYLEAKIDAASRSGARFDRAEFWREIEDAKIDVKGMNVRDCLRKDYKQWTENGKTIGVTTVVCSLSVLREKSGSPEKLEDEIKNFAKSKGVDVCAVMTAFMDSNDSFHRELLILPISQELESYADEFEQQSGEYLQLQKHEISIPNECSKVWWQKNLAASRKQVAPPLRESLKSMKAKV